ncbi:MAG: TRAP transporter substrate-binding protein [Capnocytophaga sp.]|nr:TRAP transporter substrate-binding protein [Capnocytophaga sp.]
MKHLKLLTYSIWFVLLLSMIMGCKRESQTKTLTFAHNLPTSHPVHKGVEVFKAHLEHISGGKLSIQIYANGQLGTEREVLELLQIGSISMTKVSSSAISNFVPEYLIFGIPYLFEDKDHFFRTLEGNIGEELLAKGHHYWLHGLCFYDAGSRSFYTKSKFIKTPEDLKNMKIRVMGDKMSVAMVKSLGGSPTPMAFGELYTALQQGVVDGAENNAPSFVTSVHYEICKYYTLDEHSYMPDVVIIGTKFLEKLSPQEQEWVFEAAKVSAQKQKEFWQQAEQESMEVLKAAQVQFFYPEKEAFSTKTDFLKNEFFKDKKMVQLIEDIEKLKKQ